MSNCLRLNLGGKITRKREANLRKVDWSETETRTSREVAFMTVSRNEQFGGGEKTTLGSKNVDNAGAYKA